MLEENILAEFDLFLKALILILKPHQYHKVSKLPAHLMNTAQAIRLKNANPLILGNTYQFSLPTFQEPNQISIVNLLYTKLEKKE